MIDLSGCVDLHVHSCRSDGSLTPSQLVDLALQKNLQAIALTDHDSIEGIPEALSYSEDKPVTVIPGIEFSTEYFGKDVHIVGLFIDYRHPAFLANIGQFVNSRILRNEKMCAALRKEVGMDISYPALLEAFPEAVITRAHYARYMLAKGYVSSLPEAFDRYIGDHAPYFIPREKIKPQDAIDLILQAKGIPVLAHPLLYGLGHEQLEILVQSLKTAGLMALEAIYSTYSQADESKMRRLAQKYDLLISGGSDFHGAAKPDLELGSGYGNLRIPADILYTLQDRKNKLFLQNT